MLCAGTRRLERRSDVPHRGCRLVGDAKRVVSPPRRHVPDRDESFRSRAESFLFFSEAEAPGEAAPGPFAGCQGLRAAPKTAPEARGRTNDARRQVVTSSGTSLRQSSGQCPLTELSVTGVSRDCPSFRDDPIAEIEGGLHLTPTSFALPAGGQGKGSAVGPRHGRALDHHGRDTGRHAGDLLFTDHYAARVLLESNWGWVYRVLAVTPGS